MKTSEIAVVKKFEFSVVFYNCMFDFVFVFKKDKNTKPQLSYLRDFAFLELEIKQNIMKIRNSQGNDIRIQKVIGILDDG